MAKPTYNDKLAEYFGKRKTAFHQDGGPVKPRLALPQWKPNIGDVMEYASEDAKFGDTDFLGNKGFANYQPFWWQKDQNREQVRITDNRTTHPITGDPINPNRDLMGGKYDKELINKMVRISNAYGVDPLETIAIGLQETNLGTAEEHAGNFGHTLTVGTKEFEKHLGVSEKDYQNLSNEDRNIMSIIAALKRGPKIAKSLGLSGKEFELQAYNGFGKVTPRTEADYHGFESPKFYGVDVTKEPLDMKKNPVYGKTILSLVDMLKSNPAIQTALKDPRNNPRKFQSGGYASGDPLNFMFPSSGLVPSYAQDGLSGYFEDPLMLPHAKGGGFFGKVWKGIKNGFGAAADQTLSFFGAPNVIKNSVYDQQPQWAQSLNSGVGSVMSGVLGSAIPGAGLGLAALQGLGNASQGQRGGFGGQMDFSGFGGGQPDTNQYNVGSLLQGLMGGGQGFSGQNNPFGPLMANLQGRGFGGINPFGTPGFNPQPRMYEDGGEVQQGPAMIPIQTEKGEVFVHLDGSITPVNAKKTHKQMDDDEVTDVVPEGTYVTSNDKKIRMTLKQAEDIVMGLKALPYEEFTKGKLPEEQLFSEIFGNNKKMTPAEMTQKILRKFPTMDRSTTWNKNDIFTEITNKENMNNRLPWLEQVIQFNESRRGKQPTQTFKQGGVVRMEGVRHLPKGGSVGKFPSGGDILSVLGTAAPFLMDLFGANKGKSNIDPIARNMILGSSPLYAAGLNANINSQNNQYATAIQDFTGLGQNLNNFAGAQAGANIAGRALQQTDFKNFDPLLQDQRLANFQTRTPNAVIDALSTPRYDLNALAGTLGPRAFGNFTSQMINSENETRNNAIIGQFNQDRSMGLNVLGQRNALDSFSQQFNIGQGEKQQQARNAQTAGIFGDVSSYFGRLGDIQSQILPITTQFALQKAQLAGQKQMGTAQNLMNTGSIYAQLGNQSNYGKQQGGGGQQQQSKQTGNYDFLKNIIFGSNTNTGNPIGNNFSNIGNMIGQLFGGGIQQQNNNNLYGNPNNYQDCINGYSTITGMPC